MMPNISKTDLDVINNAVIASRSSFKPTNITMFGNEITQENFNNVMFTATIPKINSTLSPFKQFEDLDKNELNRLRFIAEVLYMMAEINIFSGGIMFHDGYKNYMKTAYALVTCIGGFDKLQYYSHFDKTYQTPAVQEAFNAYKTLLGLSDEKE